MERAVAEEGEEEEALAAAGEAGDAVPRSISTIMADRWYGEARASDSDPGNSSSWLAALPSPALPSMGLHKRGSWFPSMFSGPDLSSASRPWRLRMAEQLVGVPVLNAAETIRQGILLAPEPLPAAAIKFALRALSGVVVAWAHANADRVFVVFGCYVLATSAAFSASKRLLKAIIGHTPLLGRLLRRPLGWASDVLFPTTFFGPYLAAYIAVRLVVDAAMDREAARKAMVSDAEQAPAAFDPFETDSSDLEEAEAEPYKYRPQTTLRRRQTEGLQGVAVGSPRAQRRRRVLNHSFSSYLRSGGGQGGRGRQQQQDQQQQQPRGRRRMPAPSLLCRGSGRRAGAAGGEV